MLQPLLLAVPNEEIKHDKSSTNSHQKHQWLAELSCDGRAGNITLEESDLHHCCISQRSRAHCVGRQLQLWRRADDQLSVQFSSTHSPRLCHHHTVVRNLGRLANVCETNHSISSRENDMYKLLHSARLVSLDLVLTTC